MLNFAFSPEIKHKQRPFERCFFPLVYLVLQNNHALRQNTMNDNDILFNNHSNHTIFQDACMPSQKPHL